MWRHTVLACTLVSGILTGRASAETPILFPFVEGDTQFAVRRAAEGAADRLARHACQGLFDHFTNPSGQRLSTVLAAKGKSPAEAFGLLRFADESAAPQCRTGHTLAFTHVGSPLIRVCGLQFRDRFAWDRRTAEVILIHEFLHALGLGENPPTSSEITKQVAARCAQ